MPKSIVEAPAELLVAALAAAAAQRKRAATAAATQYGLDHILTKTLQQEQATFTHAATTVQEQK